MCGPVSTTVSDRLLSREGQGSTRSSVATRSPKDKRNARVVCELRPQELSLATTSTAFPSTSPGFSSFTEPPRSQPISRTPQDWLNVIAHEVVRHVHEAPVFHLVFDRKPHGGQMVTTRKQVSESDVTNPDNWPLMRQTVLDSDPDAVVLVHKLSEDDLSKRYGDSLEGELPAESRGTSARDSSGSSILGLVVLGKSSRRHACYILQTTRVCSRTGAATHFSFTRAKCFGPSLHQQIEQAWLTL